MALKIDPAKIASGDLTRDEIIYLQVRGKLPKHIRPLSRNPETGEFMTQVDFLDQYAHLTIEQLEDLLERKRVERVQKTPTIQDKGGIIIEAEVIPETYDEGWSNPKRQTELVNRGLSALGNKQELIDRLLRSDRGEPPTPDDLPPNTTEE